MTDATTAAGQDATPAAGHDTAATTGAGHDTAATPAAGPSLRARHAALLARRDLIGRPLAAQLALVTDQWIQEVFHMAAGAVVHDLALLAVGGYGRGELAPGSDLDLVLVHRNRKDVGRVAEAIWYPIWDQGISLDHSVRTAREVGAAMDGDLRVALGLLDARTVAGSTALGAEVAAACLDKWRGRAKRWLPDLARSVQARHDAAGDLAFLLEPDLKESRGGLRDLTLLLGLAKVLPDLADLAADDRLAPAAGALTAARGELQRATGRGVNRLSLQDQDAVAAALGLDADSLMASMAEAGRAVAWASDDAWRRIDRQVGSRRRRRAWVPDPIEPGIVVRGGEVTVAYGADTADDATLALRMAAASAELDLPMAPDAIAALATSAPAPEGVWPDELRHALLRLLGAGHPAVAAWETLDQQGAIVRLLPEWAAVRNKPQRNAYHRYTVDRHLLEATAAATTLSRRVVRPDLLLLATLLHDIGKGYPGDHTDAGVEVVARLGPRLGLPAADVATLQTLVRLHLLIPEVATRRDLDDPATVAAVAGAVGDRETLHLLASLVEADSRATGPAAWGSWKAGLVAALVERTERALDGHPAPIQPPAPTDEQRRLLDGGRLAVVRRGSRLTIAAPDRPDLLATVAGVLALDGASVRAATTRSEPPMALLVLEVAPAFDELPDEARVVADLGEALAGSLPLAERLTERQSRLPRRRPMAAGEERGGVVVTVDHAASASAALVEVRAPDRLATLWRIAGAIAADGLVITSAIVATLGADVVDAFYVVCADGSKPRSDDQAIGRLPAVITAALGTPS